MNKSEHIKNLEWKLTIAESLNEDLISKLNKLKETADWHIEDCSCSHPMSQYQLGWFEAMSLVKEILE